IRLQGMIRGGFLSAKERADLTALARNGLAEHRVARRANAILLLDKGWSCEKVAEALLLDDDTVREWRDLFATSGVEGLSRFELGGGASFLSEAQEAQLKAWIVETLPRTTRVIGTFIRREFGVEYESRSGLIKLLHRLGLEYQKPEVIGRHIDDPPVGIDRGALSANGADPCVSRQRALPSCQARTRMAGAARLPHQTALRPRLLPAFEPDRASMGSDAQEHNAQQVLRNLQGLRRGDARLPTPRRTQAMARISKRRHRQFPHHKPQGISG